MMPKSTLIAPAGVSGQIHASQSGKNYDIAPDGTVTVDVCDVTALLTAGYQHVPPTADHRVVPDDAPPVTSDATFSQELGASAIDPAKRGSERRPAPETTRQENHDHGDATPPHGEPTPQPSTEASRAEARLEVDTADRAGVDSERSSAHADTGHMGTDKATAADQAEARGQVSNHHDGAFGDFKDHAGQEGDTTTLRGKTKAEIDAAGKGA